MATSRRTGTNETVNTYNSAGGEDYSSLDTWEGDTDVDCVGTTTSYCLKIRAGAHDDSVGNWSGATTNATYRRRWCAYDGEGHSGVGKVDGSVAAIVATAAQRIINCTEDDIIVSDLVFKNTGDLGSQMRAINISSQDGCLIVGCIVMDCANADGGNDCEGIYISGGNGWMNYCVNTIVSNCDGAGFLGLTADATHHFYNCVAYGNGGTGFYRSSATVLCKNCIADQNGTNYGSVTQTTCLDGGSDTISFMDAANDDFRPKNDFSDAIQVGTDLSADGAFAFDDDIADVRTAQGGSQAGFPRYSTKWTIGSHEYWYQQKVNGTQGGKIDGTEPYDIKKHDGLENT